MQFFLGLEILFLTALGCAVARSPTRAVPAAAPWRRAPAALAGLGVAGLVVLAFAAYPLWMQFFGPQHRIGHPPGGPTS